MFHASKLVPYQDPVFPGQHPEPPPPTQITGEDEFEVKKILQKHKRGKGWQYLVRWKGYGHDQDSWEPTKHLLHAKKLITKFNKKGYKAAIVKVEYDGKDSTSEVQIM